MACPHGCAPTPVCGSLVGLNVAPPLHFRNERVLFRAWVLRDRGAMPSESVDFVSSAHDQPTIVRDRAVAQARRGPVGSGFAATSSARVRAVPRSDSRARATQEPASPLPGCLRRGPRATSATEGRWLAAVKACGEYAAAEPLRRRLSSPLAQMGRAPDRRHLHQPPPASAGSDAPPRPPSSSASSCAASPSRPRLRTITDLARTNPSTSSNAPYARPVLRGRTRAPPQHRRPRPDHRPQHRPDRQRQRGRRPGPRPQGRLRPPPRQHPLPELQLHPRPLVARGRPPRRSRQPRMARGPDRPTRRPRPPSLARSPRRTRAQNHQAAGPPRPGAVLPTPQSRRSARGGDHEVLFRPTDQRPVSVRTSGWRCSRTARSRAAG